MLKLLILMIPTLMGSEVAEQSGVVIDLDIVGHAIPLLKIPDGKYCFCPEGYNCSVPPRCQRDFQMIAELDDGTRVVEATEPMIINANGEAEDKEIDVSRCILRQCSRRKDLSFTMRLPTLPKSVHVSVSSWGAITLDGEIVPLDNFTSTKAMDFLIPFEYKHIVQREKTVYDNLYNGTLDQGTLHVRYSIICLGSFPDQLCELKCVTSKTDSELAHCVSNQDAEFWTCRRSEKFKQTSCWTSPRSDILWGHFMFVDYKYKLATVFVVFVIGLLVGFLVQTRPFSCCC